MNHSATVTVPPISIPGAPPTDAGGRTAAFDERMLRVYLDDHHAGSVAGIELAKRAARSNEGTRLGRYLGELVSDLENDQQAIRGLMGELGFKHATVKAAAGWVAEKLGRLKLNGRIVSYSPLSRVVELEGLMAGSRARVSLFASLAAVVSSELSERYTLEQRAERARLHIHALDRFRQQAAVEALRSDRR